MDGNRFTVTGLNYTESHTVSVVATSVVCLGVLNSSSSDIVVNFRIGSECVQEWLCAIQYYTGSQVLCSLCRLGSLTVLTHHSLSVDHGTSQTWYVVF